MTRLAPWKVSLTLVCLVLGLLALSNTMSSGQAPGTTVPRREYKTIFGTASKANDDQFNELGSKGWALFTAFEEPNGVVRFVFHRVNGIAPAPKDDN
jgi:hypothetical protein